MKINLCLVACWGGELRLKTETMLKWMYAVTAVFVCVAAAVAAAMIMHRSEVRIVWSDHPEEMQIWADNANALKEKMDALFPEREPKETNTSNEILPNFSALVNMNTAGKEELMTLPGIGEILAERIIQYRTMHGDFKAAEELKKVSGIGEKIYAAICDLITV